MACSSVEHIWKMEKHYIYNEEEIAVDVQL